MNRRIVLGLMLISLSSFAQEGGTTQKTEAQRVEELEKKVQVLTDEVQNAKAGYEIIPTVGETKYGLSPAASKVYRVHKGVSLGGYGEMLYSNYASEDQSGAPSGKSNILDFVRQIVYVGYRFTDKFLLNSEIEFEHGSTDKGGSVSVEFAYLDYLHKDLLNFRAGMMLIPMGLVNEMHEPTTFLSSRRPLTERYILPSTWRENGFGIFGANDNISYRLYVVNGFDASGFTAEKGLRDGRQSGASALANDFGITGRLDYTGVTGLVAGVSTYTGQASQNMSNTLGKIDSLTSIVDIHADYRIAGFQFRWLTAYAHINEAGQLSSALGLVGDQGIGSDMLGFYGEVGYDVLHHRSSEQKLLPFVRYESVDTQYRVAGGFTSNGSNDQEVYTFGLTYLPIVNIALKADYELARNKASTGVSQWNLAMGYIF